MVMDRIIISAAEAKEKAVECMRDCMAYITTGDMRWANISYGRADVYENMYFDLTGEYLDEVDEYYEEMQNIYGKEMQL